MSFTVSHCLFDNSTFFRVTLVYLDEAVLLENAEQPDLMDFPELREMLDFLDDLVRTETREQLADLSPDDPVMTEPLEKTEPLDFPELRETLV